MELVGTTYRGYDGVVHTATLPSAMGGTISARRAYEILKFNRQQGIVSKHRAAGQLGEIEAARNFQRAYREAIERAALYEQITPATGTPTRPATGAARARRAQGDFSGLPRWVVAADRGGATAYVGRGQPIQGSGAAAADAETSGNMSATAMQTPGSNTLSGAVVGAGADDGEGADGEGAGDATAPPRHKRIAPLQQTEEIMLRRAERKAIGAYEILQEAQQAVDAAREAGEEPTERQMHKLASAERNYRQKQADFERSMGDVRRARYERASTTDPYEDGKEDEGEEGGDEDVEEGDLNPPNAQNPQNPPDPQNTQNPAVVDEEAEEEEVAPVAETPAPAPAPAAAPAVTVVPAAGATSSAPLTGQGLTPAGNGVVPAATLLGAGAIPQTFGPPVVLADESIIETLAAMVAANAEAGLPGAAPSTAGFQNTATDAQLAAAQAAAAAAQGHNGNTPAGPPPPAEAAAAAAANAAFAASQAAAAAAAAALLSPTPNGQGGQGPPPRTAPRELEAQLATEERDEAATGEVVEAAAMVRQLMSPGGVKPRTTGKEGSRQFGLAMLNVLKDSATFRVTNRYVAERELGGKADERDAEGQRITTTRLLKQADSIRARMLSARTTVLEDFGMHGIRWNAVEKKFDHPNKAEALAMTRLAEVESHRAAGTMRDLLPTLVAYARLHNYSSFMDDVFRANSVRTTRGRSAAVAAAIEAASST